MLARERRVAWCAVVIALVMVQAAHADGGGGVHSTTTRNSASVHAEVGGRAARGVSRDAGRRSEDSEQGGSSGNGSASDHDQFAEHAEKIGVTRSALIEGLCYQARSEGLDDSFCEDHTPTPDAPGAPAPVIDPAVAAREAIATLTLPTPTIHIGPPASINEWNATVVNYPYWLWTTGPDQLHTTVTSQGITITIDATRTTTSYSLGDGTHLHCPTSTPWTRDVTPGEPSPTCGHTFHRAGPHRITQTDTWSITWTALGQTGTLERTTTATTTLALRELVSLRVR